MISTESMVNGYNETSDTKSGWRRNSEFFDIVGQVSYEIHGYQVKGDQEKMREYALAHRLFQVLIRIESHVATAGYDPVGQGAFRLLHRPRIW